MAELGTHQLNVQQNSIDLSIIEPERQFEYFADGLINIFSTHSCDKVSTRNDFPASWKSFRIGQSQVSLVECPSIHYSRTRNHIDNDNDQFVFFDCLLEGEVHIDANGERKLIKPGNFYSGDSQQPYIYRVTGKEDYAKAISVILRQENYLKPELHRSMIQVDRFTHHRLSPLLRMTLAQIAKSLQEMRVTECIKLLAMVESVLSLIALDNTNLKNERLSDKHILCLVESEIDSSIGEHDLNLESIAYRLSLPKRRMQRIFSDQQTTFTEFLWGKRMRLGMRMLRSRHISAKSIAEIAYECGYSEQASFHRAFKRYYGCTPGEI